MFGNHLVSMMNHLQRADLLAVKARIGIKFQFNIFHLHLPFSVYCLFLCYANKKKQIFQFFDHFIKVFQTNQSKI